MEGSKSEEFAEVLDRNGNVIHRDYELDAFEWVLEHPLDSHMVKLEGDAEPISIDQWSVELDEL
ncbi:hypothetical protein SEA_BING_53 [Streptomyces phage Bing]|uniref:Uncharacterized protein n=1 Tax=Streptomyces phage Bing TaxID=2079427 RepID=A0A2L1IWE1_9CAUD|nr:hypothetical protein FDJ31_gp53 [Streptomyces phage Bing]AVD99475.1 hypothetical protein SEA_BING_53 [Streptomyces phage Bing]